MPIRVKCESCKKTLSVKDHLAGKKIKCPVCQTVVTVPAASVSPSPAAPVGKPAPAVGAKKPAAVGKPAVGRPAADKAKPNGAVPPAEKAQSNGIPAPPEPETVERPPENLEAEALAAFADEPKPPEEETEPQFIDFKCDWCDEMVKLPIEMAGKQAQCPNPECKRLVKVPLLKKAEKKDWKKMDQRGPAAAIVNQPEQLENAWGTQQATKAKQSSLAQAGAIEKPPPTPRDFVDRLRLAIYVVLVTAAVGGAGVGIYRLVTANKQHNALKDAEALVERKNPKIKDHLLAAHAHRAIGLLNLREGKPYKAREHLNGSLSLVEIGEPDDKRPAINEQLALIDLALAQIELAGTEDEILGKTKLDWEKVRESLSAILQKIKTPEVRVLAMREIGTRLLEKRQKEIAVGLAASLANTDESSRKTMLRQQIAMQYATLSAEEADKLVPKKPDAAKPEHNARVGYAEGCARKDDFAEAIKIALMPGSTRDRLEACLGVGMVALQVKNKEKANDASKEAVSLVKSSKETISPWLHLQVVRLAARTDDLETAKDLAKNLPAPFKLRAQLEIFLAVCEKATSEVPLDALDDLEAADKEGGATLALAWLALAQQNARNGRSRDRNRAIFEERISSLGLPAEVVDKLRPMVDVGTYLGSTK